jgi:hypothetical protein
MQTLDMREASAIDEDEDFSAESALDWQGVSRQRDMGRQLGISTIASLVVAEQGHTALLTIWFDDGPLNFG